MRKFMLMFPLNAVAAIELTFYEEWARDFLIGVILATLLLIFIIIKEIVLKVVKPEKDKQNLKKHSISDGILIPVIIVFVTVIIFILLFT